MSEMVEHNIYRVKVYNSEKKITYSFRVAAFNDRDAELKVASLVTKNNENIGQFTVKATILNNEKVFV